MTTIADSKDEAFAKISDLALEKKNICKVCLVALVPEPNIKS